MKQYKGEAVLKHMTARLIASDNKYPDSMCELLLTDYYFYVLEDNFDGTYIEYFAIPLRRIDAMEDVVYENKDKGKASGASAGNSLAATVITVLCGFVPLGGKGRESAAKTRYLRITYSDISRDREVLFFSECSENINKFIREFEAKKKAGV